MHYMLLLFGSPPSIVVFSITFTLGYLYAWACGQIQLALGVRLGSSLRLCQLKLYFFHMIFLSFYSRPRDIHSVP